MIRIYAQPWLALALILIVTPLNFAADSPQPEIVAVEGQPLAANVERLLQALDFLGTKLPKQTTQDLLAAVKERDPKKLQELLDPHVLVLVSLSPEARVKAARGPAEAKLQQGGYTPFIVKVVNDSTVNKTLHLTSPQAGKVYNDKDGKDRFLEVEMYASPPLTANLSGLKVEYAFALIYSTEAGQREATLSFDVGQGTQDLGFRAEAPVLFDVRPGVPVKLSVTDTDGKPTVGRFTFKDTAGHVYPPQAKRLAPDFFFQQQIYRDDGGSVLLPPGEFTMQFGRGPEYRLLERKVVIPEKGEAKIAVKLERWIKPSDYGFYCGDHHIHAAGCAHYTNPTEGVFAKDMFLHVKGEGLNVGCNLTWGPCYEFQRQFFEAKPNKISEPFTVLKYDIEVSGFGSQALGHVCLLNLREQTYPGSDGTKTKGWPTWTTPVMNWAKQQGAVTGYAHSANGLEVNAAAAAKRLLTQLDTDKDGKLGKDEAAKGLLPEDFDKIDANKDGFLTEDELKASIGRVAGVLPNLANPGDGRHRSAGNLRHDRATSVRLHQRDGHGPRAGMELLVSHHELRLPAQGERRNRFPVHQRQPRRPGPRLRAARQGRQGRFHRLVRGYCQGAVVRLRRLRARAGIHGGRQGSGRPSGIEGTRRGKDQGQGCLRLRDSAGDLERRRRADGQDAQGGGRCQRRGGGVARRAGRRQRTRPDVHGQDREKQLGGAAAFPSNAHQSGERPCRRQADSRVAKERVVVHRSHRAALACARKGHRGAGARGS